LHQINLNCIGPVTLVREFAQPMRERGRGGIVIVGATACLAGAPVIVVYSAAKAFEVNFAEGLWAELQPNGVDVCCTVLSGTDTPARARMGVGFDPQSDMLAEDVATEIIDNIGNGPTHIVGERNRALAEDWITYRPIGMAALNEVMQAWAQRKRE
jgi:short-subunit dehydrogenase